VISISFLLLRFFFFLRSSPFAFRLSVPISRPPPHSAPSPGFPSLTASIRSWKVGSQARDVRPYVGGGIPLEIEQCRVLPIGLHFSPPLLPAHSTFPYPLSHVSTVAALIPPELLMVFLVLGFDGLPPPGPVGIATSYPPLRSLDPPRCPFCDGLIRALVPFPFYSIGWGTLTSQFIRIR